MLTRFGRRKRVSGEGEAEGAGGLIGGGGEESVGTRACGRGRGGQAMAVCWALEGLGKMDAPS